ncbi:trypsin-like serine peptidase [Streptomyces sp. NPDC058373]|uniref:trypsin-like serine peptidase n=1 Tax=Streptomyces sp. NPDC058373 TaxID=3346465 RepID=UPI00365E254C
MRPIRPLLTGRRRGARGRAGSASAVALCAALALTATACGPEDDHAGGDPSASASTATDDKIRIPDSVKDRLKEHGLNLDEWKDGAWKDFSRDDWLREAEDYINPIIEDLWDPDRMREAEDPTEREVDEEDISGDQGVTDPTPQPVDATAVDAKYHDQAPEAGKLLFDGPDGSMVCSATVIADPANPGKSNLVWTAGHCVHAGKDGGWYRNIIFVPSYNDGALSTEQLQNASQEEVAPYGVWWSDWAQTSDQWIEQGGQTGGDGAPYDFAVLHVTQEKGQSKSLEETVGSALPVDFNAPAADRMSSLTATGYPAAPPFDGQKMFQCADKPGRLSVTKGDPTMHRIGCTMTGGSSGGGWVAEGADGKPALVSNTSIGPVTAGWLAGPRLGKEAEGIYTAVSKKFAAK